MKILAVDDEPLHRDMLAAALAKFPEYQLTTTGDARSAWTLLNERRHRFDLLLLDIRMPDMSGLELLTQIAESPGHQSLKIVMCTAVKDRSVIVQAIQRGAHHYIIKPWTEAALLAKLALVKKSVRQDAAGQLVGATG